jgi:hypothetical protein
MDATLLERAQDEVKEIKSELGLGTDEPVKYQPKAWTRQGFAD